MAKTPITWDGADAQGQPLRWDTPGLTWNGFLPQPSKKMPQLRVLLGFASASDHSLEETAQAVLEGMYPNPDFPSPPVTEAALQAALSAFSAAIAVAAQGGPEQTADKNNTRETLAGLLRQLAAYVQANHGNDLAKLLSSGFEAVSTNSASAPLTAPTIKDVLNSGTGQLTLRLTRVKNAKAYEIRHALLPESGAPGPWVDGLRFTSSRAQVITGLTPGANYQFQARAVGGSTGYSDWSDAVSHRSL